MDINNQDSTPSTKRLTHTSKYNRYDRTDYGLTGKQQEFVEAYLADPSRNATDAYRKAYGNSNDNACSTGGSRLLRHKRVLRCIEEKERKMRVKAARKLDISHERWLGSLAQCAYADPRQLFDSKGFIKPPQEISDELAQAIEQVEVTVVGENIMSYRYRLVSKAKSQELLGKAMKWLEQTGVNLNVSAPRFNFNIGHTANPKAEPSPRQIEGEKCA